MAETVNEPDLQTVTAVGKVLVTDDSTALLLGLLDHSATKLWNSAVWHATACGQPVAWRKTRPLVSAHEPGTWQTSLRIREQDKQRLLAAREPDSGILGLQAGEDVKTFIIQLRTCWRLYGDR